MYRNVLITATLVSISAVQTGLAQTDVNNRAEIKLIDPMEDSRGWCVDLFAHLTGAQPIGGFQGHSCFLYMGNGPTEDQGFLMDAFANDQTFRLWHFDMCMTLNDPNPGSFVATEDCTGVDAQKFDWKDTGEIVPVATPDLCLTLGDLPVTGGGAVPIHLIRRLSFETCNPEIAIRQRWEWRTEWEESVPTMEPKYR